MDIERTIEFLLEQQAASQARFDAQIAQINQTLAEGAEFARRTDRRLDRAIRLAVEEARAERKKRREADEKLAAADEEQRASQRKLEASLNAYLDSLKGRTNGHDKQ